jgi:outer membrane receptor protein involved in Fe transport
LIADPLRLSLSYGYLENDVTEVEGDDPDLWSLPNAPKNSATATLAWDIAQLSFGALNFTIDSSYRDDSNTAARQRPGDGVPSYSLTNLQLSLEGQDWVGTNPGCACGLMRNVFDEEYYSDTPGSFAAMRRKSPRTDPANLRRDVSFRY